jgi:hypothetical protein
VRTRRALLLACGAAALARVPAARANAAPEYVGKYFPARLAGESRLTWFGLHVYDARLFVPAVFRADDPVAYPFALELTYARSLEGKAIAETSRDEIARLGFGSEASRKRWFEQMVRMLPDVERGTRIAGVNLPDRGARFYVDGRFAGGIDEPPFARAFFAIWLDARTRSPRMREELLRGAGPLASAASLQEPAPIADHLAAPHGGGGSGRGPSGQVDPSSAPTLALPKNLAPSPAESGGGLGRGVAQRRRARSAPTLALPRVAGEGTVPGRRQAHKPMQQAEVS